jgi:hypothetical protein
LYENKKKKEKAIGTRHLFCFFSGIYPSYLKKRNSLGVIPSMQFFLPYHNISLLFISTSGFRMNYCNLAKVILAREAKEKALIDLIHQVIMTG